MDLYQTIIGPFAEFDFMRYALASVVFLALSAAPVGLMMLPAITARLWARNMGMLLLLSVLVALLCGFGGLLFSYYVEIPSGPAIILWCGVCYLVSVLIGWESGVLPKWLRRRRHHKA